VKVAATSAFVMASGLGVLGLIAACSGGDGAFAPQSVLPTSTTSAKAPEEPTISNIVGSSTVPPPVDTNVVGDGCGGGVLKSAPGPVFFYFVADGSGSMDCSGPNDKECKRKAQEQALRSIYTNFRDAKDNGLGVGMIYFGPDGSYPAAADVPIRAVDESHFLKLMQRIAKFPDGGTPTEEALTGAYNELDSYEGVAPLPKKAKKVVILLSDGEPNGDKSDIYTLVDKYAKRVKDPVLTYSVGVGNPSGGFGYDPKFMAQVAIKGKTARPNCNPNATSGNNYCHFQVTPGSGSTAALAAQFVKALTDIRGEANACEVALELVDTRGQPANPEFITVTTVDAETKAEKGKLAKSATDGWTFDDEANPTRVIINGPACDTLKADKTLGVQVKLGCKTGEQ
jgi:von Willebrand factor type A domain